MLSWNQKQVFLPLNVLTLAFLMKAVQEYSSKSDAQGVF